MWELPLPSSCHAPFKRPRGLRLSSCVLLGRGGDRVHASRRASSRSWRKRMSLALPIPRSHDTVAVFVCVHRCNALTCLVPNPDSPRASIIGSKQNCPPRVKDTPAGGGQIATRLERDGVTVRGKTTWQEEVTRGVRRRVLFRGASLSQAIFFQKIWIIPCTVNSVTCCSPVHYK
jgi:hypothetical protein